MRKFLLLLLASLLLCQTVQAQIPPYFNSNTSTQANLVPLNPGSNDSYRKVQDIFAPGEFTGAPGGRIDTVWIRVASTVASAGPYANFEISMGQNIGTSTTSSTTFNTGLTSVYINNAFSIPAIADGDWLAIPLSTPFPYNPALSLVVEVKSTGNSGTGVNVYRANEALRRVYGAYAAATGTTFSGPMEFGLTIDPWEVPPYFNSNTSTQANLVPLNPGSNDSFRKVQDIHGPGEFTGAPGGRISTVWIRVASTVASAGPYSNFEVSMGQNIGTSTTATTTFNTGLTSVYSNNAFSVSDIANGQWLAIPLPVPFIYDPALSLVVEIKSTANSGTGINVYRANAALRRVYGEYAAATGTTLSGPVEFGISLIAPEVPPYFSSNTSTQGNLVPLNPGSNANYRKVQDIYGPGEFTGAPAGPIDTVWIRMASSAASGAGPYASFEVSMGQNIGTSTTATTSFNAGLTTVYSNSSFAIPPIAVDEWLAIPLPNPFTYNPSLSLVVEIKSTANGGSGVNIYRANTTLRRVYGEYAATSGTTLGGPMDLGLSVFDRIFKDGFD